MIKKMSAVMLSIVMTFVIFIANPNRVSAQTATSIGVVTTQSTGLTVRSNPSTSHAKVSTLNKGSYVTLISKSNGWWKVMYAKNMYGYCSAAYITEVSASAGYVSVSSGNLNVRSGPSTGYPIQDRLANKTEIMIVSQTNGWCKIVYNGTKSGYVSSTYVAFYTQSQYTPSNLNMQNFKQTDSRWSGTVLGNSGKTILNSGCAVCCLAMTESYRTKTTITPNTMASKLNFTSGGAVYWPSNYKSSTSTAYLNTIYNKLKSNIPVLLCAKTSGGSTHYVVVRGFKGGSLTPSNFLINDPGSNSRTTLAQLYEKYPKFSKIVYY